MARFWEFLEALKVAEGTPEGFRRGVGKEIKLREIPPAKPLRPHSRIRDIQDIPLPPKGQVG